MSTVMKTEETGAANPFHMGDRIRKARDHAGMNRQDFAHAVGIHRDTLAKYEDTGQNVKRPALLSIALASGVRLEWLESGELPWVNENPHQSPSGGSKVGPAVLETATSTVQRKAKNGEYKAEKMPGLRGAYIFDRAYIMRLVAKRQSRAAA